MVISGAIYGPPPAMAPNNNSHTIGALSPEPAAARSSATLAPR
jgi:hypothetical protein